MWLRTSVPCLRPLILAALVGCSSHADELEKVCQAFSELAAQPALGTMSYNERMTFVDARVSDRLGRFGAVRSLWKLVPNYEATARYRMFKRTADELLGRSWSCPDMERMAPLLSEPAPEGH